MSRSRITLGPEGLVSQGDKLKHSLLKDIESILKEARCEKGAIHLKKNGTVSFSKTIPPSCHQRIRNLIHLAP